MPLSKIKILALDITNELHILSLPYIKNRIVKEFLIRYGKPRIDNIITQEMPEEEVKKIMWECKKKLDGYFKMLDKAEEIQNTKYNDPLLIAKLMKLPDFKELEGLM